MKQFTKRFITMVLSLFVIMSSIPFTNSVLPNLIPLNQITAEAANYRSDYWTFPVPTRNLKKISPNQRGNDVKWFQSAINNLIANGDRSNSRLSIAKLDVDGVFGTASRNATITFQKKYNLSADGIFGPASRAKMQAVLKPRNISHTHNYVLQKTVAATCGNYGYKEYRCSCGLAQKTLTTNPTSNHNYQLQRIGLNLNAKCSNCNYEEKAISYQRYLTIIKQNHNMTYFCNYLNSRGYVDLAKQYKTSDGIPSVFLYYRRQDYEDKISCLEEECDYMINYQKINGGAYNNYVKIWVRDAAEFKEVWNNLIPPTINHAHMFFHGDTGKIYFEGADNLITAKEIESLNPKTVNYGLYLYSCSGAGSTSNYFNNSPAKAFRNICSEGVVVGCADSGVNYTGAAQYLPPKINDVIQAWDYVVTHDYYPVRKDTKNGKWVTFKNDGSVKIRYKLVF